MAEPPETSDGPAPARAPGGGLAEALADVDPGRTLAEVMASVMERYADRPALGERAVDPATGALLPRFDTIDYRELWRRVRAVAARWHHDPTHRLDAGERVCTLGFTGIDHATLDLACMHLGVVPVPLPTGGSPSALRPIIAEAEPRVLAASVERLDTAVEAVLDAPSVRHLIVLDHDRDHDRWPGARPDPVAFARRRLAEAGAPVVVETLAEVIDRGAAHPPAPLFAPAPDEDPPALLIYTSGSTGAPKGAVHTHRMVGTAWYGFSYGGADESPVSVLYLPQSHLAGRYALMGSLVRGGVGHCTARADLSTLLEDIALVRPTELTMVPRVCDMLFQWYRGELARRAAHPGDATDAIREELRESLLGGRVTKAFVGSAPLSAELAAFMESCLGFPLHTGYGSTEAGGVLLDEVVQRPPVRDYKLVDVPELGYHGTDLPFPRGELLLKSDTLFPGYHKRPELTASVFDADGYYRTGDVFAEIGPDRLRHVDRVKDTVKLSQGEFVAVSSLECVLQGDPLIRQAYVYANSERAHLLAVLVPAEDAVARCGGDPEALDPLIRGALRRTAREAGLAPYEIPRDFLIETEPFSPENGLLTDSHKPLRPRLRERYGDALERLYEELAERRDRRLLDLRSAGPDRPVAETVGRAAQALLGGPDSAVDAGTRFTDLGGDSLSALSFSRLLEEIFHVAVPVPVIIAPDGDLAAVARHIESARDTGRRRATFASVHGEPTGEIRAGDLALDAFLDPRTLAAAPTTPRAHTPARTVLLTGATGYLGRFLCLQWLERLAADGGRLICLVRAADADTARKRLDAAFDSGDDELPHRYRAAAEGTLEVLAGDIDAPRLGLTEDTWDRLAGTVDTIVHAAALVNHVLPYDQLFGPNVAGTAEMIRLALTTRRKPVTYVSTVAVGSGAGPGVLDEDADIRDTIPARPLDAGHAGGYATGKWAGEVLLREAHDSFDLPVAVFRSDLVLAHRRYRGQLNTSDLLTRLLLGILTTGIAPRSFHRPGPRPHHEGLPVDFTAEAITTLGAGITEGHHTFHVVNPHDDGISLDTFVDWLVDAGHPIRRVEDHATWLTRFTAALRALPEARRRHSPLPLLPALAHPLPAIAGSGVPAERFRAAVRAARVGPDHDIPHLSADLVRKYVTDLRRLGLLDEPRSVPATG
ncbi:carboxylic acid reductase (plasmid) [Streptomyces sp. BI20]|uniref:carboxylic acid reductase n=1 Tax=Streptomyces sp. BI20 TaxID=3403460 RepID=UPI003C75E110